MTTATEDKKDEQTTASTGGSSSASKPAASKPAAKKSAAKRAPKRTANTGGDRSNTSTSDDDDLPPDEPISPGAGVTHRQVEVERRKQLDRGKARGDRAKVAKQLVEEGSPVEQRAGHLGVTLGDGRVDNMSRRDDSDALFGHFVLIDFGDDEFGDDAKKAVEQIIGEGNAGLGAGDYGVFVDVGDRDGKGYPKTVTVMLRDEHAAQVPGIPYGALRPAPGQGGRR